MTRNNNTTPTETDARHEYREEVRYDDHPLGTQTVQAIEMDVSEPAEDSSHPDATDAWEIRRAFGLDPYSQGGGHGILDDIIIKEKPARRTKSAGGAGYLRKGERGCGKSTHNLQHAARLLDDELADGSSMPAETVVWRGSPNRSEWLPVGPWTTLWLPEAAEVDPTLEHDRDAPREDVDLEEWVREVRRYQSVLDLVERLEQTPAGSFHAVYPDPSFSGCEKICNDSDRTSVNLPFRAQTREIEDSTPLPHWWFAFLLGIVDERGSYSWLSVIFDELSELTPADAEDDEHRTHKKVRLFSDLMVDSRRRKVSFCGSIHKETDLAWQARAESMRRIHMPDDSPNPQKRKSRTHPVGFDHVPMYKDIMSNRKIGTGLIYDKGAFDLFQWKDLLAHYRSPGTIRIRMSAVVQEDGTDVPKVQYDSGIFRRYSRGDEDRLVVRDPGSGYLDVHTGSEVEPLLDPPLDGYRFGGIVPATVDDEDVIEVELIEVDSQETEIVARIRRDDVGLDAGVSSRPNSAPNDPESDVDLEGVADD